MWSWRPRPQYWQSPEALQICIRHAPPAGAQVPLSAFATYGPTNTPLGVNHQGQFVASTISFNLAADVSLSQATRAIEETMATVGCARRPCAARSRAARALFRHRSASQPMADPGGPAHRLHRPRCSLRKLRASDHHPVDACPPRGSARFSALLLFKTDFSIIAFIGVILLIGIVKKECDHDDRLRACRGARRAA